MEAKLSELISAMARRLDKIGTDVENLERRATTATPKMQAALLRVALISVEAFAKDFRTHIDDYQVILKDQQENEKNKTPPHPVDGENNGSEPEHSG